MIYLPSTYSSNLAQGPGQGALTFIDAGRMLRMPSSVIQPDATASKVSPAAIPCCSGTTSVPWRNCAPIVATSVPTLQNGNGVGISIPQAGADIGSGTGLCFGGSGISQDLKSLAMAPPPGILTSQCDHAAFWKRLRAKEGFAHYVCTYCGLKWRVPSLRTLLSNKLLRELAEPPAGVVNASMNSHHNFNQAFMESADPLSTGTVKPHPDSITLADVKAVENSTTTLHNLPFFNSENMNHSTVSAELPSQLSELYPFRELKPRIIPTCTAAPFHVEGHKDKQETWCSAMPSRPPVDPRQAVVNRITQALQVPSLSSADVDVDAAVHSVQEAISAHGEFPVTKPRVGFARIGLISFPTPVCHGSRCTHVDHWKRLRAKQGISYYVCKLCGCKWRAPSLRTIIATKHGSSIPLQQQQQQQELEEEQQEQQQSYTIGALIDELDLTQTKTKEAKGVPESVNISVIPPFSEDDVPITSATLSLNKKGTRNLSLTQLIIPANDHWDNNGEMGAITSEQVSPAFREVSKFVLLNDDGLLEGM